MALAGFCSPARRKACGSLFLTPGRNWSRRSETKAEGAGAVSGLLAAS